MSKGKILIVDDELFVAEYAQALLNRQGYRCTLYTDPRDALAAFRADPDRFSILITDLSMPNLTGLELADAIRSMSEGFPVIAVANGTEALAAMDTPAGRFGLLVTEGILSGASTLEVIERALILDPDCRVVIASAHVPDQLLQRGVDTGTYVLLPKPFDAGQLREAVNEAVGRKSAAPSEAGAA